MWNIVLFLLAVMAVMAVHAKGFENNMDLLKSEGEEGWMEKVINAKRKINEPKLDEELSRNTRTTNDPVEKLQELDVAITKADFKPQAAERPKRLIGEIKAKWTSTTPEKKEAIAAVLASATENIPNLANAKADPIGAIQAALGIMASISHYTGPTGQLVSVGFMLISSLLGLFGEGQKAPKPIGDIVREEINEALAEFHDQLISDEAGAAVFAFRISKAYVDGAGKGRDKISDNDVAPLATNVPVLSGVRVMGLLAIQIDKIKKDTSGPGLSSKAKKCFKYLELYLKLATLRDMIMTQVIGLIPESHPATIDGYKNAQVVLQDATRSMLEFLYTPEKGLSRLMPYFDGEKYPYTTAYMKTALKLERPNRFPGSGYCISAHEQGKNYLSKFFKEHMNPERKYPIAQVSITAYCKWKLLDHGGDLFSIISEDGMLSFDNSGYGPAFVPFVTITHDDLALWNIRSFHGGYRIRIKYFCNLNMRCNSGINYKKHTFKYFGDLHRPMEITILAAYLDKSTTTFVPWMIYKPHQGDTPDSDEDFHGEEKDANQEGRPIPSDNINDEYAMEGRPIPSDNINDEYDMGENLAEKEMGQSNDDDTNILELEGTKGWLQKLLAKAKEKESKKKGGKKNDDSQEKEKASHGQE